MDGCLGLGPSPNIQQTLRRLNSGAYAGKWGALCIGEIAVTSKTIDYCQIAIGNIIDWTMMHQDRGAKRKKVICSLACPSSIQKISHKTQCYAQRSSRLSGLVIAAPCEANEPSKRCSCTNSSSGLLLKKR